MAEPPIPEPIPDPPQAIRARATRRLVAALALIAAAVAALTLLDRAAEDRVVEAPAPPPPPPPIAEAPKADLPPPAEPAPVPDTPPPPPVVESDEPVKGMPAQQEAPPAPVIPEDTAPRITVTPKSGGGSRAGAEGRPPRDSAPRQTALPLALDISGAEKPPRAPSEPLIEPVSPEAKAFVVEVSEISTIARAEKLRDELRKAGLKVRTEVHLQVGPFADRAEAERALERLREMGFKGAVVSRR